VLESLDAAALRRWCGAGLAALRRHQQEIDQLNVYPVPDRDTGTNLVLTFEAAHRALAEPDGGAGSGAGSGAEFVAGSEAAGRAGSVAGAGTDGAAPPLGRALRRMSRGALLGARGNSGVIIAQLLAGLADELATAPAATGADLARALDRAAVAAWSAVGAPVDGTMLSVATAAARAAEHAGGTDLPTVVRAAAEGAAKALAQTPEQLSVLARAGVVDAGGRGLVVLLDALVEVVTGAAPPDPGVRAGRPRPALADREAGSTDLAYEVQYLLDAGPVAVEALRAELAPLGDSLAVVGDGSGIWHVHVHVNDVGAAIEAGIRAGRPHRICVTRFADAAGPAAPRAVPAGPTAAGPPAAGSMAAGPLAGGPPAGESPGAGPPGGESPAAGPPGGESPAAAAPIPAAGSAAEAVAGAAPAVAGPAVDPATRVTVVVATGDGLAALFRAEGAWIVPGPNPSVAQLLAGIRATAAGQVALLPGDRSVRAVATLAAEQARAEGVEVGVVPVRSPVQALAALAVRSPQRQFVDDVIAMAESAGACRYAEVCVAESEAVTVAGVCRPGDILALVEGEVNLIGTELRQTCLDLADRLLAGGGELVTLLTGADAPADLAELMRTHLARRWPFVEVQTFYGGQPWYPLLMGVE
jgi:uncharacterized protein